MALTQEQFNQGIKNQFQEVMCDWFLMQDQNGRFMAKHAPSNVMRFDTENLVYTDSKTLEPVIKELIKVSQPLSNQTTVIKVGINDLDSQGAEFEAEREQPPYAFFGENRHDLGRYTLYKLTGHSQTDFVQKMQPNDYAAAPDPFFVALGFAGEKGVKELILQEHLRWNANYLGEGIVYGQVKDLDGVGGRKTTPWIVSSDELWSRANAVISHPRFDKEGLEYIALTDDAKKVRDSLFWDLEWLQNLARYSPNSVERCNKDIAEFEKYAKSVLANYPQLTASVSDIRSNSMMKTENLLKKFREGDKVMEIVKQDLEKAREQEIKAKKQSQMSGIGD